MPLSENKNIRKILIIRLSSIGDIILSTELIRLVNDEFPLAQIDFLIAKPFVSLLEKNPRISNIIPYDKTKSKKEILQERDSFLLEHGIDKYDLIIDLQNNFRSSQWSLDKGYRVRLKKYRIEKLAMVHFKQEKKLPPIPDRYINTVKKFGIKPDGLGLELWLDNSDYPLVQAQTNSPKRIGISPGAKHFTKRWPTKKFIELIAELNDIYDCEFHLFGGQEDKLISDEIESGSPGTIVNHSGNLSLLESAYEIDKCDLMITNDTGLMHLSAARKIPLVAIFGSTTKALGFEPYGTQYEIVERDLSCRPCSHIGRDTCPKKHFKCMNDIEITDVLDAVRNLLIT